MSRLNVAIGADITELEKGWGKAIKLIADGGKEMSIDVAKAAKDIQDRLNTLANSKPTARVVRQLQTMAIEARAMGPEFAAMADQFVKAAGKMQDEIGDTRAEIGYFASDTRRLDALIGGAQAVAAGFGVVEGSMAALGIESENAQKTMQKLQGALLVLNSLQTITTLLQKDQALMQGVLTAAQGAYTFAVTASTTALGVFKLALAATGIGAAIVGVAYLVQNFDELSAKIWPAEAALKAYNKAVDRQIQADQYSIDLASAKGDKMAEFAAKEKKLNDELSKARANYGKNEQENWGKIIADNKNALKVLRIERDKFIKDEKDKQDKANKDKYQKQQDEIKKAKQNDLAKRAELLAINNGSLAELIAAEDAAFKVREAQMREQGYTQVEINKVRDAALEKVRKEFYDKQKADEEKAAREAEQKAKELADVKKSISQALAVGEEAQRKQEIQNITDYYSKLIQDAKKNGLDSAALIKAQGEAENALKQKFREQDARREMEQMQKQLQFRQNIYAQFGDALSSFNEAFAKEGDEAARKQAQRAKAISISQALVSTYFAAQQAYLSQFLPVPDPSSPVRGKIAAAASVAVGLGNVAKIATQKFADGGIVYGPTLGLMGEYPGARSNPEVIAPLDKLRDLITPSGGDGGFIASTHISGRDLAIVLNRHNNDYSRG